MKGSLTVIAGPMFSGKSEELLRLVRRAMIAKRSVVVFKPSRDDRYSKSRIVSHNGTQIESVAVDDRNPQSLFGYIDWHKTDLVAIDEIQFFAEDVLDVIDSFIDKGIHVIVAGLNLDSWKKPFGPMPQLLAKADHIEKLSAVCKECGDDNATLSQLLDTSQSSPSDHIVVGGSEKYEARCRNCHTVPK